LHDQPVILPDAFSSKHNATEITLYGTDVVQLSGKSLGKSLFSFKKNGDQHAVIIPANRSIPLTTATCSLFYFEITVLSLGENPPGVIGIGLVPLYHSMSGMPGWHNRSYGYHGDDGKKFHGTDNGQGSEYGPVWNQNSVVGCGYDQSAGDIFFTLNGKHLGVAFHNAFGEYLPCVGMRSKGAKVLINFGKEQFKYCLSDFKTYNMKEHLRKVIARSVAQGYCTFNVTKKSYAPQFLYHCLTCGLVGNLGCCEVCAKICHKDHKITQRGYSTGFFCDCGSGDGIDDCKARTAQRLVVHKPKKKKSQLEKPNGNPPIPKKTEGRS